MRTRPGVRSVILGLAVLALAGTARAQSEAEEVARANNPLAPITAINIQNYYVPTLYGLPDQQADSLLLRGILGTRKMILRATLPLSTSPSGASESASGLGGAAVVVITTPAPTVLVGGLVTYQHSLAGGSDRPDTSLLAAQPIAILQFGAGFSRGRMAWSAPSRCP